MRLEQKSSLPVWTYRQQRLNVLLQEGGDVLPVQDVSQPAVLPLRCHLVAGPTSGVGHVLRQRQCFFNNDTVVTVSGDPVLTGRKLP